MKIMTKYLLVSIILVLILSCTNKEIGDKGRFDAGIKYINILANPTNEIQKLAIANYGADSNPAGLVSYYYASLPNSTDNKYCNICSNKDDLAKWSIFVKAGEKQGTMMLEAYGEDLEKPLFTEEIIFGVKK